MRKAITVGLLAVAMTVPATIGAPPALADQVSWATEVALSATVAQVDPGDAVALRDGTLLAVWGQATTVDGAQTPYAGTTSTAGTTAAILDGAGNTAAQPVVATSDDGTVRVAAWKSTSGASRVLRWARWTGAAWTPAATLTMPNLSETVPLDLALSRDGQFGVLAAVSSGGTPYAFRFNGTGFAPAEQMASPVVSMAHPVVAVAGAAPRAMVGWIQVPSGGSTTRFLARRWNGASWDAQAASVSQEPAGRSTVQGTLAMSADGETAMAAWRSQQGADWSVAAARATGSAWGTASPLTDVPYAALDSLDLALVDDATIAQVAFSAKSTAAGNNVFVVSNRYAAGAWDGVTVRSGPFRPEALPRPSLAMSRDGSRGLLVYQEWDGSNNKQARALRYADGAWGSPLGVSLGSFHANDASGVGIAVLNGNGTLGGAVWRQQTGGQQYARAERLTIRTAPTAARNVTAQVIAPDKVLVSWLPSEFDGNWPFPDYAAIAGPNDGTPCSTISTSCVVTGLQPGQTYRFTVYAENVVGATASQASDPVTMPGGTPTDPAPSDPAPTQSPPTEGTTSPTGSDPAAIPPVTGAGTTTAPGAIAAVAVKQRKRVGDRKRAIRVRWSPAPDATAYRIRITKPGGKRWRDWATQTSTRTRYTLPVAKRYRVSVVPIAGTTVGTPIVKRFRVRR